LAGVRFRRGQFAAAWRRLAEGTRDLILTTSLNPAFSPRRRRIVRRLSEKPATEFAERSSAKPKPASSYFLSPGERIKGEGGRKKTNYIFPPIQSVSGLLLHHRFRQFEFAVE
jgi:hypothetical protein